MQKKNLSDKPGNRARKPSRLRSKKSCCRTRDKYVRTNLLFLLDSPYMPTRFLCFISHNRLGETLNPKKPAEECRIPQETRRKFFFTFPTPRTHFPRCPRPTRFLPKMLQRSRWAARCCPPMPFLPKMLQRSRWPARWPPLLR